MPIQTQYDYYSNEDNWGGYQFTDLKTIIDEMMLSQLDPDSYLSNTRRSLLVMHAKNGIHELSKEVKRTILAIERTVGETLFFPLPQDYVDWVRISVVMPDFKLKPLRINNNIPTAIGYLQDNAYDLLFDSDGDVLMANSINLYNKPYHKYKVDICENMAGNYGEFVIDENRGTIGFSSDLFDKEVVIEYCSDGLQMHNLKEEEITIHKSLKRVLKEWIYMECVSGRRNVPRNEKDRTKLAYKTMLHKAKIDRMAFSIHDVGRKMEVPENM